MGKPSENRLVVSRRKTEITIASSKPLSKLPQGVVLVSLNVRTARCDYLIQFFILRLPFAFLSLLSPIPIQNPAPPYADTTPAIRLATSIPAILTFVYGRRAMVM